MYYRNHIPFFFLIQRYYNLEITQRGFSHLVNIFIENNDSLLNLCWLIASNGQICKKLVWNIGSAMLGYKSLPKSFLTRKLFFSFFFGIIDFSYVPRSVKSIFIAKTQPGRSFHRKGLRKKHLKCIRILHLDIFLRTQFSTAFDSNCKEKNIVDC